MKKSKQCPKCSSLRVGRFETVPDRDSQRGDAPAAVGRTRDKGGWLMLKGDLIGALEAYLCADCGYYETYVKEPDSLPYDQLEGFEWVNP